MMSLFFEVISEQSSVYLDLLVQLNDKFGAKILQKKLEQRSRIDTESCYSSVQKSQIRSRHGWERQDLSDYKISQQDCNNLRYHMFDLNFHRAIHIPGMVGQGTLVLQYANYLLVIAKNISICSCHELLKTSGAKGGCMWVCALFPKV